MNPILGGSLFYENLPVQPSRRHSGIHIQTTWARVKAPSHWAAPVTWWVPCLAPQKPHTQAFRQGFSIAEFQLSECLKYFNHGAISKKQLRPCASEQGLSTKETLGFIISQYKRTKVWSHQLLLCSLSTQTPGWATGPCALCSAKDWHFMASLLEHSTPRAQPAAPTLLTETPAQNVFLNNWTLETGCQTSGAICLTGNIQDSAWQGCWYTSLNPCFQQKVGPYDLQSCIPT